MKKGSSLRDSPKKPVIGITSDFNPGDQEDVGKTEPTFFLRARYISAILELGAIPIVLPITNQPGHLQALLDRIDGLLLTGSGPDLDPLLYGEPKRYKFKIMSRERADFELAITRLAIERQVPILGICGGMQVINVAFGGTLIQDIPAEVREALPHRQKESAEIPSHEVKILPGSLLSRIVRESMIRVNSSHHQSVKTLGNDLVANAVAPDGVIEGLERPQGGFILGVQWHPEFMYQKHEPSRRLFTAFLEKAAESIT